MPFERRVENEGAYSNEDYSAMKESESRAMGQPYRSQDTMQSKKNERNVAQSIVELFKGVALAVRHRFHHDTRALDRTSAM